MHARSRALPQKPPKAKRLWLDMTYAGYNHRRSQEILESVKIMAVAEVWDAAVLMASVWPLASGAAWAIPLQWRWVWQLLSP